MPGDEYELMPERTLSSMKKELEEFRKQSRNTDSKTGLPKETITSIENLNSSISSLLGLFKTATEELKLEERDEALISKKMDPLMKKVDTLLDQNEKIAKAIVAIADMIREKTDVTEKEEEEEYARPEPKTEAPSMFPPRREAPMPPPRMPPLRPSMEGFPPPPPTGAPEPMPPWEMPGLMPGLDEEKPKKKPMLGGLFGKK